jgi:hypothetical protein
MNLPLVATVAVVWAATFVFALPLILGLCRAAARKTPVPPRPVRFAPDAALIEDEQVAELDALWDLPARSHR